MWSYSFLLALLCAVPAYGTIKCDFMDTVNITGGYKDVDQNFIYKSDVFPPGTYQEFDYIVDYSHNRTKVDAHIRGCVCKLKPCIRMCCLENFQECSESDTLVVQNEYNESEEINVTDTKYGILIGRPCSSMYQLAEDEYETDWWNLLNNGSLKTTHELRNTDSYCLGFNEELKTVAYLCFHNNKEDYRFSVYPIGMLISIPFLLITFCVYACIPELRNLHGKCLMCYILSLTFLFALLILVQGNGIDFEFNICCAIGYLIYTFMMLSFFWMNAMCYDIWTITRNGNNHRSITKERKRFGIYCAFTFGGTALITLTAMLIDFFKIFEDKYLPLIGHYKCWIQPDFIVEAIFVYFPISVIILVNIGFFMDTARKIWKVQSTSDAHDARKRKRMIRRRFFIYLRLFILMGLMWCMESISWIFKDKSKFFLVFDMLNCLHGVLIFIICACDPRTRRLVAKRLFPTRFSKNDDETYAEEFEVSESVKLTTIK